MSKMINVFLGVDIGGSHVGVGCISATDGTLLCSYSSPLSSHSTFVELIDFICETALTMFEREKGEYNVVSIGIGCPGQCKDGLLIGACIFSE